MGNKSCIRLLASTAFVALAAFPSMAVADDDAAGANDDGAQGRLEWDTEEDENAGSTRSEFLVRVGSDEPASPAVHTPATNLVWTGLPHLGSTDDGEYCIARNWVQLPPDEVAEAERNAWLAISYMFASIPELQGLRPTDDCPVDPADEVPPRLLGDVVHGTVIDHLPRPEPSVPPGHAMTGMAAYLVTDHELTYGPVDHDVDLDIFQLTVRVTGTATSTVDWGDGTVITYDQPGRAYPDGKVTHAYADAGATDIEIVDSWQLSFDVYRGGELIISDIIEFDLAPVVLEDLEIRELQAVRTSSD